MPSPPWRHLDANPRCRSTADADQVTASVRSRNGMLIPNGHRWPDHRAEARAHGHCAGNPVECPGDIPERSLAYSVHALAVLCCAPIGIVCDNATIIVAWPSCRPEHRCAYNAECYRYPQSVEDQIVTVTPGWSLDRGSASTTDIEHMVGALRGAPDAGHADEAWRACNRPARPDAGGSRMNRHECPQTPRLASRSLTCWFADRHRGSSTGSPSTGAI